MKAGGTQCSLEERTTKFSKKHMPIHVLAYDFKTRKMWAAKKLEISRKKIAFLGFHFWFLDARLEFEFLERLGKMGCFRIVFGFFGWNGHFDPFDVATSHAEHAVETRQRLGNGLNSFIVAQTAHG